MTRWILCLAVFALLLKAAVPMLASAAAHLHGESVATVCDVYGVALPGPKPRQEQHAQHTGHVHHADQSVPDHGSKALHSGDHCALTALAALVPQAFAPVAVPPVTLHREVRFPIALVAPRDANASWAARLMHGPPSLS
jgi:hypothetical protein